MVEEDKMETGWRFKFDRQRREELAAQTVEERFRQDGQAEEFRG